jgi:hypothetical protein
VESEPSVSSGFSRLDNLRAINGLPQIRIVPSDVHEEILRGLSLQANYTDRATVASRRS